MTAQELDPTCLEPFKPHFEDDLVSASAVRGKLMFLSPIWTSAAVCECTFLMMAKYNHAEDERFTDCTCNTLLMAAAAYQLHVKDFSLLHVKCGT